MEADTYTVAVQLLERELDRLLLDDDDRHADAISWLTLTIRHMPDGPHVHDLPQVQALIVSIFDAVMYVYMHTHSRKTVVGVSVAVRKSPNMTLNATERDRMSLLCSFLHASGICIQARIVLVDKPVQT